MLPTTPLQNQCPRDPTSSNRSPTNRQTFTSPTSRKLLKKEERCPLNVISPPQGLKNNKSGRKQNVLNERQKEISFQKQSVETKLQNAMQKAKYSSASKTSDKSSFIHGLSHSIKKFFLEKPKYKSLFSELDVAFNIIKEVSQRVKCYRVELGCLMENSINIVNNLLLRLLNLVTITINEHHNMNQNILGENLKTLKELETKTQLLSEKNNYYKQALTIKESETEIYRAKIDFLKDETEYLNQFLKNNYMIRNLNANGGAYIPADGGEGGENMKEGQSNTGGGQFSTGVGTDTEGANTVKSMTEVQKLGTDIKDLFGLITGIEEEQTEKRSIVGDMNNLLKAMLKGEKYDVSTQVNEGLLYWDVKQIDQPMMTYVNLGAGSLKDNTVNILDKDDLTKNLNDLDNENLIEIGKKAIEGLIKENLQIQSPGQANSPSGGDAHNNSKTNDKSGTNVS
jgi:hypothetical protein